MLLAIDIGNTSTKFGVFEAEGLVDKFLIPTVREYSVDELLFDRLKYIRDRFFKIDTVIASSVVPELNETFSKASIELLKVSPSFVDHEYNFGFKIKYQTATTAGTDRLVNAAAATAFYGAPVIVCSFGTATTIDAVNSAKEFLGGMIAPGMKTLAEALHLKTSKLPFVDIKKPDRVIGTTTEECIRSGVFFGYMDLVEGLLKRIITELDETPQVVGTGGFAGTVHENSDLINLVDENLTLKGLRLLSEARST